MWQPYHRGLWMNVKSLAISLLFGAFILNAALLTAGAQDCVNQPYSADQPYSLMPQAGMPLMEAASEPFLGAPVAAPVVPGPISGVAACGPYTSGFVYSAQRSAAFGPFTPPVAEASERFYQMPGLTPFGPYPGAGYALAGGVGFDPATGYYGPYGAYEPL